MRSLRFPSLVCGMLALALTTVPASRIAAQPAQQCFDTTGYCISGRFLEYWRENGGLAVFGYPLGPAAPPVSSRGGAVLTQHFERQRFELHPDTAPPYDVLATSTDSTPAPSDASLVCAD